MEFKAKIVDNKVLKIQCHTEIIKHKDGRQDVIIHAPALSTIRDTIKAQVLETKTARHPNGRQDVTIAIKDKEE